MRELGITFDEGGRVVGEYVVHLRNHPGVHITPHARFEDGVSRPIRGYGVQRTVAAFAGALERIERTDGGRRVVWSMAAGLVSDAVVPHVEPDAIGVKVSSETGAAVLHLPVAPDERRRPRGRGGA